MPTLSITAKGILHLHASLREKLGLRYGQPINLLPPYAHGDTYWYLDLRATAPHNIDWYPGKRAKIKRVELPPSLTLPEQGLTLLLLPGPPAYEGFYPMISYPI